MRRALLCLIAFLSLGVLSVPSPAIGQEESTGALTDVECDPYPIGRCGAYQREQVTFCYVLQGGIYRPATDPEAMPIGPEELDVETGVPAVDEAMVYFRSKPWDTFLADPNTAPFPVNFLYQESNAIAGVQPTNFKCGIWTWFAECIPQQWMGPTGVVNKVKDTVLV